MLPLFLLFAGLSILYVQSDPFAFTSIRKGTSATFKHGVLSFESAIDIDFESALVHVDDRNEYGETRYVALGLLADRLHVLCFAEAADGIRVISFGKANAREVARHAKFKAAD